MGLRIIISSAVELKEKTEVKKKLEKMQELHLIRISENGIYDCNEHGTFWAPKSKQDKINDIIRNVDWFICLIPQNTVGEATWGELKTILELRKKGDPVVVSVFHPVNMPESDHVVPIEEGRVSFNNILDALDSEKLVKMSESEQEESELSKRVSFVDILLEAKQILGSETDQYVVNYEYNNEDDLLQKLHEEYIKLYYKDQAFRTQHLISLAQKGCKVRASDLYFDKERASSNNGFVPNKYFPRKSVDGKLKDALDNESKFIVLLGSLGSGKTRAVYQLLKDYKELNNFTSEQFSLGYLSEKNIIIINKENIHKVYDFLKCEKDYDQESQQELFLICDQLKDVFSVLSKEKLFSFFDIVEQLSHVRMISTSIPSAFKNFCDRWSEYGRKPFDDDELTTTITIPQISSDKEEEQLKNWIQSELHGNLSGETIGDYIPRLNSYKQNIVIKLYEKSKELPFLSNFLSAVQIAETYRYDTALFIPIVIARKKIFKQNNSLSQSEFNQEMAKTINFLIANNVLWITYYKRGMAKANVVEQIVEKAFELEYGLDDEQDFWFDGELFKETPISTTYSYVVNEMIWSELELQEADKHLTNRNMGHMTNTLLLDFQDAIDVKKSYTDYYSAFPFISSLRRILPRIPRTDCYNMTVEYSREFVFDECQKAHFNNDVDIKEFLITIGILISRSKDFDALEQSISIITQRNLSPDYNIIGELYSAGIRLGVESYRQIDQYVSDIRKQYNLLDNSFFSIAKEILFKNLTFDEATEYIRQSSFKISTIEGDKVYRFDDIDIGVANKIEVYSLEQLLTLLANKAENILQWRYVFDLHQHAHVFLRRSLIRRFFSVVEEEDNRFRCNKDIVEKSNNLIKEQLCFLLNRYSDIIAEEDRKSCYFYSAEFSRDFKQGFSIYELYFNNYFEDNSMLISIILRAIHDDEFQTALNFLITVNSRLKKKGGELNLICFNNLIKAAPNMGEALGVVPYLSYFQDHTLANILTVLKNNRKNDSKIFFYAYSAVMQDVFFELRKSPYVIGLLYDLAATLKHERFIRDVFLSHLENKKEKSKLIDHSTGICSIRLQKKYRTLAEAWNIFKTCRDFYYDNNLYVSSEIYSGLMRKILYLCKNDQNELSIQQDKLRDIIKEDFHRIVRDEYFYSIIYRFFPEKKVVDDFGRISEQFIKDMDESNVSHVKVFNNIMLNLKSQGFDILWDFYEFVVKYYQQHYRWTTLRPDIRTITYLMEAVRTKAQYEKVKEVATIWCPEDIINSNTTYINARENAIECFNYDEVVNDDIPMETHKENHSPNTLYTRRNYKEETDEVIDLAIKDIYLYGSLTATLFNRYLKIINGIIEDITNDINLRTIVVNKCKHGTYNNLLTNLIEKHEKNLNFDALSYVYLIKMSPDEKNVRKWLNKLIDRKEVYKYDMVVCAKVAQSIPVSRIDYDISREFYCYWRKIMKDIGYDPSDPTSRSEMTEKLLFNGADDYDGYWLTNSTHIKRVLSHYAYCLKRDSNFIDEEILDFIKCQMDIFEQYRIVFPDFAHFGLNYKDGVIELQLA